MNLKTFAKAVRRSAGKNASKILGGLAITGSITAQEQSIRRVFVGPRADAAGGIADSV